MRLFSMSVLAFFSAAVFLVLSEPAHAGMFTTAVYTSPTDLGLDSNAGIVQAVGLNTGGAITVGAVTFATNSGGLFTGNYQSTWSASSPHLLPAFSDTNLNSLVDPFTAASEYFTPGHATPGATSSGTITGLVVGKTYELQFFMYDGDATSGSNSPTYRGTTTITTSGASVGTLAAFNDMAALGDPASLPSNQGVYIDYNFIAATTSLAVTFTVDGDASTPASSSVVLAAFDLRTVPEPASLTLVGLGGLLLFKRGKRN